MELAFWLSLVFVAYVYAGYPLLLLLWARVRPQPALRLRAAAPRPVSIIVAARNEAARLPGRIDNLLQIPYPAARQLIVVSDGSTDDTLGVLERYRGLVDVVSIPASGKALALNAGVERARHDLLVFADARQSFEPDALTELIAPFVDPGVGAVTGELLLDCEHAERRADEERRRAGDAAAPPIERRTGVDRRTVASTIADGIGLYWKYEKALRRLESATGSTLGATGAIYAMRRELWRPLPAGAILDDVLAPMRCVLAGSRVVFNDRARATDRAAADAEAEARRKSRTLAGNWQILALEPALLLPWRNPVWIQYLSHKVGRLLVPFALVLLFVSALAAAWRSPVYAAAFAAQCLAYLLAGYGAWLELRGRIDMAGPSGTVHA
jgi:cellulose synthase/poly-beta-1,6-N-acetylglucosamine synthase-like glycosyltransferase